MTPHVLASRFSRSVSASAALVLLLGIAFASYAWSEGQEDRADDVRHRSLLLADELHQTGEELTRMVRGYVATGDPVFRRHIQDILDIRAGRKPRPQGYPRPEWELLAPGGSPPLPDMPQTIPLTELMRRAGFTPEEFRKLAEARANAEVQAARELEAMKLIESGGPEAEAARARAQGMLYDATYHQAQAAAMKPLHDFIEMVDRRTLAAVQAAEYRDRALQGVFVAIGLGLLFSLWRTYAILGEILGGRLDEVHAQLGKVASGDLSAAITPSQGRENSVMGWLAATQARLIDGDRERLRAEMALRGSEENYRLVADNADDWVYWVAPDGKLRFSSPSCERVSGYSVAELTDRPNLISEIVHPEDQADFLRHSEKVPDRHESDSLEFRIITKTGGVRWISHSCGPIHTREGLYAGRLGTNRDVTARRQAEEDVRESESHYRSLFDNMLNGYAHIRLIFDGDRPVDFVYLGVNPAFEALTGLTAVVGKRVTEVIPGIRETDPGLFETYGRVARTGVPERSETWVEALKEWYSLSVYRPAPDRVVVVFDIITRRKRSEARTAEQVDELRRWHAATVGRELRVLDLKKEINDLLTQYGQPPRYPSVWPDGGR
jgi:PAS domain S-box-containing protein